MKKRLQVSNNAKSYVKKDTSQMEKLNLLQFFLIQQQKQ